MDRRYGHNHHHERKDDDDYDRDERPPPPQHRPQPPYYSENEFAPPPQSHYPNPYAPPPSSYQPPPQSFYQQDSGYAAPPPPQVSHVYHSSPTPPHGYGGGGGGGYFPPNSSVTHNYEPAIPPPETHHGHFPTFHRHESSHETGSGTGGGFDLYNKPSYKVYCKAAPDFHLTVRDGKVVLARSDPSDQFQNWFKDEKFSTKVKDEEGSPCFSLVNKATGQSMKHSLGAGHPVQMVPYNPNALDESVLWTMSKDFGEGYRTMRMVNNILLNVDAFHGDKKSGGVHDGTTIVLWKWNKGDNQLWKVAPNPR